MNKFTKYTFEIVQQNIIEKCKNKIISENDKCFFLRLLKKCPEEANNIGAWIVLGKKKG